MGLNDDAEMLQACRADAAQLERDLALAHTSIDLERHHRLRAEQALTAVRRLCDEHAHDLRDWEDAPYRAVEVDDLLAIIGPEPNHATGEEP